MTEKDMLDALVRTGVVRSGHFVLTEGDHTDTYIDKHRIIFGPYATDFYRGLASRFRGHGVETVVGPVSGGALLAKGVAFHLSMMDGSNILPVYAEKDGEGNFFVNGLNLHLVREKNILVVDDVLTTGRSVRKNIDLVCRLGGRVVGVGAVCNRGGDRPKLTIGVGREELAVLVDIKVDSWSEDGCRLCVSAVPIDQELGHGKEFLARKGQGQAVV